MNEQNNGGIIMKKIGLICATALLGTSLVGCGNSTNHKAVSSSQNSSSKVIRHHKRSSSKGSSESNSIVKQKADNQSATQQSNNSQIQQATNKSSANKSMPQNTGNLSDFVNRYGESPAAYMMDHYGMSQSQALNSVPDNMKSSGELQYQEGVKQGYIQP